MITSLALSQNYLRIVYSVPSLRIEIQRLIIIRFQLTMHINILQMQNVASSAACSRQAALCNARAPQPSSSGRFQTASSPPLTKLQTARRQQRHSLSRVAATSSLDDLSLFPGSSGSSLEAPTTSGSNPRKGAIKIEDVPLNTEVTGTDPRLLYSSS